MLTKQAIKFSLGGAKQTNLYNKYFTNKIEKLIVIFKDKT